MGLCPGASLKVLQSGSTQDISFLPTTMEKFDNDGTVKDSDQCKKYVHSVEQEGKEVRVQRVAWTYTTSAGAIRLKF